MCMSDRSKCYYLLLGLVLLGLSSCWGDKRLPEDQAKAVLKESLTALQRHDVDTYINNVDFGTDMDSLQEAFMRHVLEQHQDRQDQLRGAVQGIEMIDAEMQGDSVCLVFYQLMFPDSTVEVASQKMVRVGEKWKIRVRN